MISIYTITEYLTPKNRTRVFPLLFDLFYLENDAKEYFQINRYIEKSQVAIFPIDINHLYRNKEEEIVSEFIEIANKANIPVWIYSAGDYGLTINKKVFTFRLGGFHSKMMANDYILPSFVSDPFQNFLNHSWQALQKREIPTIGFVGNANGSFLKLIKEMNVYLYTMITKIFKKDPSDIQPFYPSSTIRFKLLKKLATNNKIETSFIYRKKYNDGKDNLESKEKKRNEFYQNIESNLYTFCIRGAGNFSVRFYETLVMGRIPVLIDTDVRLPLQNIINWEKHCIIANKDNFVDKIINFHVNHTSQEIINIQISNRKLALETLNRISYFVTISKSLLQE